ncbi:Vegetative incompatibility protein HET-E-1 [Ceratobasidium theobromae]|uniref:Vegetative incompatibility protein HET-E-1 n=1 Tax=Ceratobasidium theobromae TaxID=1582974 RepID=A0A5N5QC92_9AGAM|nr:Vegetative incompatibility protein HET-E-1 [Ceratobasidium theobromae]
MGSLLSRPSDQQTRSHNTWDLPQNIKNWIKRTAGSNKAKAAGHTAWTTLETTLRLLERSSDVFPPLKSAVAGLIGCLDIIQAAAGNDQDYADLASRFAGMANTLSRYMNELDPAEANDDKITGIIQSIDTQVSHIAQKRGRGKGKRLLESKEDQDDVTKCYREIERLFQELQNDISLRTLSEVRKQREMSLLGGLSTVTDAKYNSSYSTTIKRRGCTASTREKVQGDLRKWVQDPNGAKVFWMSGMAGTGKTTLADFSRIVPTIARQLAQCSPPFRTALRQALVENPEVGGQNIVLQFKELLQEPLSKSEAEISKGLVVIIDALDECGNKAGVRLMLEMLLRFAPNLPLKLFVTSRPEPVIHDKMTSPEGIPPTLMHLHDVEQDLVERDIQKYLTEVLSPMRPPPKKRQIERLARNSGRLFIYAATVARYIYPDDIPVDSATRLKTMLMTNVERPKGGSGKQYEELDQLYNTVLSLAFDKRLEESELANMRRVLWTAVCAREPMTVKTMSSVLNLTYDQVSLALRPLRSVLHVSEGSEVVSTLHASFPDYLLDHSRSGSEKFHCDEPEHSEFLAHRCFEVMKGLRFNICELESSFVLDKDVPDLDDRAEEAISPPPFSTHVGEFLFQRLLFWMEVLNLRKCIGVGAGMLLQVQNWLSENNGLGDIQKHTGDARNFVTTFTASPCSHSTPHIYISALPLCPKSSSVYKCYWERTRGLMDVKGTIIDEREGAALAVWEGADKISQAAFSPNGDRIVTAEGYSVWVRDSQTGTVVAGPFEGHTERVVSVAFSPDGTRIVSGSEDKTVRMWDSQTGSTAAGPFEGHTESVLSVAFSPDGNRIVSGSDDSTIRVWDLQTVAFSPNGTCIVSGSEDNTIRMWDSQTGSSAAGPFKGHTSSVTSVSFSLDRTHIVSGSEDNTIRVWNSQTGSAAAGPFKGHRYTVTSVAFSPDGTRIVSGSDDSTIRVWDLQTGLIAAGPFEGHTSLVTPVAFSPDGTRIVSGSKDNTIRVWDSQTGSAAAATGLFEGCASWVTSVAFSPNGTRIVSGSADNTIRMWDLQTSSAAVGPFEGHTSSVTSVAFSPDGTCIVSGSTDNTIRVWTTIGQFVESTELSHSLVPKLGSTQVESTEFIVTRRWAFNNDGWAVTNNDEILFWAPSDFHEIFQNFPTLLCISHQGSIRVEHWDVLFGDRWSDCFVL